MTTSRPRRPSRWPAWSALFALVMATFWASAVWPQSDVAAFPLALRGVGDVVVDSVHDRVFISQGPKYNGLVVTNLEGAFVATVDNQPGASGMVLAPDGSTLYVALSAGNAISALDPTTLVERTRYDLGASCPSDLAWAGDRLWTIESCVTGSLGALDPGTGAWQLVDPGVYGVKLAASRGAPGTLVLAASGSVHLLEVSGSTATLVRSTTLSARYGLGLALSPDGNTIYVANGDVVALRSADLSVQARYARSGIDIGVLALSPDGGALAVTAPGGAAVLRGDTLRELRSIPYDAGPPLALAFGPTGGRLFSATILWRGPGQLSILDGATKFATELTAAVTDTTVVGDQPVEIRGTLSRRSDGAPLPGMTLQPSRVQYYATLGYLSLDYPWPKALLTSPRTSLPPVTTEADGSYVVHDVPPEEGEFTYTITWAGDDETVGTTATLDAVKHAAYVDRVDLGPFPGLAYTVAISRERYPQDHSAKTAVIATDRTFADALSGSPLTADGPLLLTKPSVPQLIRGELDRVLDTSQPATVYVLGGPLAIPDPDLAAFQGPGRTVRRLWGDTRVETSIAIAEEVLRQHPGTTIALARAWGTPTNPTAAWADSVSGGGWSAEAKVPIVLTPTEELHPAVRQFLQRRGVQTSVVLGGPAAISDAVAGQVPGPSRVAGEDRAGTAAQVANQLWPAGTDRFTVANGYLTNGWIWGLAGAGLAAQRGAPILYTTRDTLPDPTRTTAARARCDTTSPFTVLGGKDVVGPTAQQQLDEVARSHC